MLTWTFETELISHSEKGASPDENSMLTYLMSVGEEARSKLERVGQHRSKQSFCLLFRSAWQVLVAKL